MIKKIILLLILLSLISGYASGTIYYVSTTGSDITGDGSLENPWLTLTHPNTNMVAGDTVYLREGTYIIATNGINPTNSGTSIENMITFSGYESETVIITGVPDITGKSSRGIYLNGNNYIKITKINFTNLYRGFGIHGGGYNEISYCEFTFRDVWADIQLTGTAKNDINNYYHSSTTLYDTENDLSGYNYRRVYNVNDKSTLFMCSSSGTDTVSGSGSSTGQFLGGDNNYWNYGDVYQITFAYPYDPAVCDIGGSSVHNYIHNNSMHGAGGFLEGQDGVPVFQIGGDVGNAEYNNYNTIEYNHIYHGGHHVFGMNKGQFNVIRHNYIHNEAWFNDSDYSENCYEQGLCGYRVVVSIANNISFSGHNLWENNKIAYGDAYGGPHLLSGGSGSGISLATPSNIYRYNDHFGNAMYGLRFGSSMGSLAINNMIYSNTFYNNGYRVGYDPHTLDQYRSGLYFYGSGSIDNVVINNLFYKHWSQNNIDTGITYMPALGVDPISLSNNVITNNYVNISTDYWSSSTPINEMNNPRFVDTDITTPLTTTLPILNLQNNSPSIDGGTYLTQSNGSGSLSTTLIVNNSFYFQDGTWGSELTTSYADWISIGNVSNVVQISSINYTTNIITLNSTMSWNDTDNIWLYQKSDGVRVLYDSAPDYGAHEYDSSAQYITTTLNMPTDNNISYNQTIIFNISSIDDTNLKNVTLYGNWASEWHANETQLITGISNTTTFTKTLPDGTYKWNALTHDDDGNSDWANLNYTFTIESSGGTPDTKFEYYTGSTWIEGPASWMLWFRGYFWSTTPNAGQSDFQPSLKITNNGTASGTPKMRLDTNTPTGITIYVDDDNDPEGAIILTNMYQNVSTELSSNTNVTLWAWCDLVNPQPWSFETYAIVE